MQKNRKDPPKELGDVVSIVGPGMKIVGDCSSDGTIRVEGKVEGSVKAGKSVVVGKDGKVKGDIATQDAIIAGEVDGSVTADSRVELQSTCRVQGDIRSRRVKLDEGGRVDGQLHMGATAARESSSGSSSSSATSASDSSGKGSSGSDDSSSSGSEEKSSDRGAGKSRAGR
ncbi:MAG: bactofilin family protein [Gemmatimonadota bacterium]